MTQERDLFTSSRNQMNNASNKYQGDALKVLCVCSAGVLRSPTAARVLTEKFGHNTRAVGMDADFALIPISEALLVWADEIVCFSVTHEIALETIIKRMPHDTGNLIDNIQTLTIDDDYDYMDKELVHLILSMYEE